MSGVRRYKDFRGRLGIANSVLTVRLRHLTEAGVFTMSQYSDAPRRYEYVLTERGRDLWKVLLTIWSWEAVWVTEHIEPMPPMYHDECGEEFSPVMYCRACGQPVGIRDVRGTFGPSGGFDRSVPRATTRRRSAGGSPGPDARLGRQVVPRARGTGHAAHPHQLRRRVPPGPALLGLPA